MQNQYRRTLAELTNIKQVHLLKLLNSDNDVKIIDRKCLANSALTIWDHFWDSLKNHYRVKTVDGTHSNEDRKLFHNWIGIVAASER